MLSSQYLLGIADELVVDLFAGGGGASTGIELAIGRHVDIAINHDPEAVSLHEANHPQTRHFVSDVFEVDPHAVCGDQAVGLLWASPDCKHFSKAKGGKPVSKKIRSLAWVVVKWAAAVRPRVICLENVEEFQTWGPLGPDNRPCPKRKGQTFQRWKRQLERMGYVVEHRELRACDYGAPTIRKRLFLVARCDGQPIVWPEATHGAPDSLPVRQKKLKPWRTAAECIDWSVTAPSIFERERPLADATCRRIAKGIMRYVVDAAEPFIVTNTTGHPGAKISEPLRTITTGGHHALAVPTLIQTGYGEREGQAPRALDLGKPLGTVVAGQKHALVQAFLAKHYTGVVGSDLADPMATVTSVDHHSLVAVTMERSNGRTTSLQRTNCGWPDGSEAGRDDLEAGAPEQLAARDTDRAETSGATEQERLLDGEDGVEGKALPPVCAHRGIHDFGRSSAGGDGHQPSGRRQVQQSAEQHGSLHSVREPRPCVQHWSEDCSAAHPPTGDRASARAGAGPAGPRVAVRRDSGSAGHIANHSFPSHATEVIAFLSAYYGTDQDPQLGEPLHTVTTKDRFGIVTVKGEPYAIVDIGLRMLTPRELYRAQGFPESYAIDKGADGRPLTKTAQVRMCGNSVCPPLARALVAANYTEAQAMRAAA